MTEPINPSQSGLKVASVRRIHGKAVLTLSNGETVTMPRALLRERAYKNGMPFDYVSFEKLIAERSFPFALEKAISLLAMRSRTEKEIRETLARNAYDEAIIDRVLARLAQAHYINDAQFAENWAASRASKGLGVRRIQMELQRKGIQADTISETLEAIDPAEQLDAAIRMAEKAARGKNLTDSRERQKVIAALARRGYDFSISKKALQSVLDAES